MVEGLLSRGDRRVGAVIPAAWRDGARFDGWGEYFSFDRWVAACRRDWAPPVDLAWYTTRERGYGEVLPWDHLDSGLDRDWLWEDWRPQLSPTAPARWKIAGGPRATSVGCARRWVQRSRRVRQENDWTEGACFPC